LQRTPLFLLLRKGRVRSPPPPPPFLPFQSRTWSPPPFFPSKNKQNYFPLVSDCPPPPLREYVFSAVFPFPSPPSFETSRAPASPHMAAGTPPWHAVSALALLSRVFSLFLKMRNVATLFSPVVEYTTNGVPPPAGSVFFLPLAVVEQTDRTPFPGMHQRRRDPEKLFPFPPLQKAVPRHPLSLFGKMMCSAKLFSIGKKPSPYLVRDSGERVPPPLGDPFFSIKIFLDAPPQNHKKKELAARIFKLPFSAEERYTPRPPFSFSGEKNFQPEAVFPPPLDSTAEAGQLPPPKEQNNIPAISLHLFFPLLEREGITPPKEEG